MTGHRGRHQAAQPEVHPAQPEAQATQPAAQADQNAIQTTQPAAQAAQNATQATSALYTPNIDAMSQKISQVMSQAMSQAIPQEMSQEMSQAINQGLAPEFASIANAINTLGAHIHTIDTNMRNIDTNMQAMESRLMEAIRGVRGNNAVAEQVYAKTKDNFLSFQKCVDGSTWERFVGSKYSLIRLQSLKSLVLGEMPENDTTREAIQELQHATTQQGIVDAIKNNYQVITGSIEVLL